MIIGSWLWPRCLDAVDEAACGPARLLIRSPFRPRVGNTRMIVTGACSASALLTRTWLDAACQAMAESGPLPSERYVAPRVTVRNREVGHQDAGEAVLQGPSSSFRFVHGPIEAVFLGKRFPVLTA